MRDADLSRRSVEVLLQDAVFRAWDPKQQFEPSFEDRLLSAVIDLRRRLRTPPVEWELYVPVEGFDPDHLPFVFGGIQLVAFGKRQLAALSRRGPARRFWDELDQKQSNLWGHPCAVVRVMARDFEAARRRARRVTREAMDCVNFVGSLNPYNHAWLRFPGAASAAAVTTAGLTVDGSGFLSHDTEGPMVPSTSLNFARPPNLEPHATARLPLQAARQSAKNRPVGCYRRRPAARAGRAAYEVEREQSFLLYVIELDPRSFPGAGR